MLLSQEYPSWKPVIKCITAVSRADLDTKLQAIRNLTDRLSSAMSSVLFSTQLRWVVVCVL